MQQSVTCIAPVNIAVIKYCKFVPLIVTLTLWNFLIFDKNLEFLGGKRNEELILPINDSLSVTLSIDDVCLTFSTFFFSLICIFFSLLALHKDDNHRRSDLR